MSGQFFKWCRTKLGQKFVRSAVTSAGGIYIACTFLPQTVLIDKYVDIFYLYNSGFKAKLSNDMQTLFDKSKDVLNIHQFYKKNIRCFPVFGFDLFHAGSFDSKFGVEIGIPKTFNYCTEDDIDKDIIRVNLEEIDWSSEYGRMLAESIVFTEKEKMFGICREILMADNKHIYIDALLPATIICLIYMINTTVNYKLQLLKRPGLLRAVFYTLSFSLGLGLYFLTTDLTQVQYETDADSKLSEMNPDFIHTGVSFYDKLLKRNIALRHLLGAKGKSLYTSCGNDNYLIRYQHLPLTNRKDFFEKKLKELQNKPESESTIEASE